MAGAECVVANPDGRKLKMSFLRWARCLGSVVLVSTMAGAFAAEPADPLVRGFLTPPDSAKPRVWWHWMVGNVTKDGITADLEWMKRVGIGGIQNFDAGLSTPQIVKERLVYMTPAWRDAFRHAVTLSDKLGLEMAIASSPGWSETGGPWVTPAEAMKKFVWSETRVRGGVPFNGVLPRPPATAGPYQNQVAGRIGDTPRPDYYADAAVVAYRAPDTDRTMAGLGAKVTSSGGRFDIAALSDGDVANGPLLPALPPEQKSWIRIELPGPTTVRGVTLITPGPAYPPPRIERELEASDDGVTFRPVAKLTLTARTVAFPPVTARFFRATFQTLTPPKPGPHAPPVFDAAGARVAEFVLHTAPVIHRFQEKAAFSAQMGLYDMATPPVPTTEAVRPEDVIDLTAQMRPDGTLNWTPPAGNWVILRFGCSLTGSRNAPASPEAVGLEVDKLNRNHVKAYLDHYLDPYHAMLGGLMGKRGLGWMVTDSWEAGVQNWTDDMLGEFERRRGYNLRRWLPVLAGRVVDSAEASDRVLWDFRKTIGDLTVENHYGAITAGLHARGMGRYSESHESGRAFIADGMEVKRDAEVPMSALWMGTPHEGYSADIRESASVAHLYGQNLVAAESLTTDNAAWGWAPEDLKPVADRELSLGLNRFVIHTSVHQPYDDKFPGIGLGVFGQWFTRHETWAELAAPWLTYLSRSSYLLQQGRAVADVLYYYGEDSNATALFGDVPPAVPAGYNYDFVNASAILHHITVKDGRLVSPSGMSYRVLALDANARWMSLPVLRRIRDLVAAGAVVVGPRPVGTPSQADDAVEVSALIGDLWDGGKIDSRNSVATVLAKASIEPDFEYSRPHPDTTLWYVHRTLQDGDLYWVNNRNARPEVVRASFRSAGRQPELWHADTGVIEPAAYEIAAGRTTVELNLEPNDAVFVVFRKPATAPSRTVTPPVETALFTLDGKWTLAFQPGRGAPASVGITSLSSWSGSADAGIKYFSGTASYTRTLDAPAAWFKPGAKLWLDLGNVKNFAQVFVNGQPLGILWLPPYRVDITPALKPGANRLEVKVTNLWVNRLIGDEQPNAKRITYTSRQFYQADSPLRPSGLLGPVRIVRSARR